ncbi:heat shock 70 kDa protein 12B-like [Saccostrea cucullata]|uniref:heat shock 70 kDa protein 12B-like n=1 Tax=Saccostrea cuccullata TaxID=36930 RepID=UPI002ED2CF2D
MSLEQKTDIKVLVAAIDFGTTYSGYAFSFKDEYEKDQTKIMANTTWVSGHKNLFSQKTPTCLLLKSDQSFHSFGYEAEDTYTDLANEEKHHSWYFFRRFKMMLHNNMTLNRETIILDESGQKKLPAMTVFAHGIRYLKDHLLNHLKVKGLDALIKEDDYIHWVLTIPAIWNDKSKQFMREAAKEAGIKSQNLSLALEPEAAALYCRMLPLERLSTASCTNLSMFQPGTRFMVLDLGGGTVDVTVQEVLSDYTLKELHKASGGAWGGTKIDEAFIQMIMGIVGSPVMSNFKKCHPADNLELVREFETKKRSVSTNVKEKITFRIPVTLVDIFEEEYDEDLKSTISQTRHKDKLMWTGDKLRMTGEMVHELFKHCSESIVNHVKELLAHPFCDGVENILMVGGFSECKLIQEAIKNNFKNNRIIIPEEAGLAIVKGAVLFGHNPKTIVSRKTKWTYGVQSNRNFESGDPPEKKIKVGGIDKCKDIFSVHVGVNETVEVGTPLEPRCYLPLHKDSDTVDIPIYVSSERFPKYTTDHTCSYVGKMSVDLEKSNNDREIEVKMTFGGTELIVEAKDTVSGNPRKAKFNFLESNN